jgi:hypothetical protein
MAMHCNFIRRQLIVFINKSSYTPAKEIKLVPLPGCTRDMNSGRVVPERPHSQPDAGLF